jgi:SAM-dependent methyltransferase
MTFNKEYSDYYDCFYKDKDYKKECEIIEKKLSKHSARFKYGSPPRILDLGCGTGKHASVFADMGFEVTGIDRSKDMIEIARKNSTNATYICDDIRSVRLGGEKFNAVTMMFSVLGYMISDEDVKAAIETARHHLVLGGLFIADFWYAPAVLAQGLRDRTVTIDGPCGKIVRTSTSTKESCIPVVHVNYTVEETRPNYSRKHTEHHTVRYFTAKDIQKFLDEGGLEFIEISAFPNTDERADERTWNAMIVARRR